MSGVGVLILFAVVAAFVCAKAGSAGGALLFFTVAVVLFVNTPAGAGLPGAVGEFVRSVDQATAPTLNGQQSADTTPVGR